MGRSTLGGDVCAPTALQPPSMETSCDGASPKTNGHGVARSGIVAPGVRVRARSRWTTMGGIAAAHAHGRVGQQCHGGAGQGQLQAADESEMVRGWLAGWQDGWVAFGRPGAVGEFVVDSRMHQVFTGLVGGGEETGRGGGTPMHSDGFGNRVWAARQPMRLLRSACGQPGWPVGARQQPAKKETHQEPMPRPA